MASVNISIGHDYDFVVAEFFDVEIFSESCTKGCNHRLQLVIVHDFFRADFFNVEHLSPKRKDCLSFCIASFFCRTTSRISLNNVKLAQFRVFERTVGKFCRKTESVAESLFSGCFLCFSCGNTCNGFTDNFFQD